jgi:hypothetical protein
MNDDTRGEPLPINPLLDHPATEWGTNNASASEAPPNPTLQRPSRWTPLAEQLTQYQDDVAEESREVL